MRIFSHFSANGLVAESFPFPRELSMEAYLIENESLLSLGDEEYKDVEVIDSELYVHCKHVEKEKGRIDLLAVYDSETFGIIELKNHKLEESDIEQLKAYVTQESRNSVFEKFNDSVASKFDQTKWIGVLVGTDIDDRLLEVIKKGNGLGSIPLYAISIKRFLHDKTQVFIISETYGPDDLSKAKNRTKYRFNDRLIPSKSKLAYEIVIWYVESKKKNGIPPSKDDLEKVFKGLQGSYGVFKTMEEALKKMEESKEKDHGGKYKRYYLDMPIELNDATIVVCNQWGSDNIGDLIAVAQKNGAKITQEQDPSKDSMKKPKAPTASRSKGRFN